MPDRTISRIVEAALTDLGEAIYVIDSKAKQLDARELNKFKERQPLCGWRLNLQFSDMVRQFDVLACEGYPWKPMRIALVDGPPFLTWPHIERDGVICLGDYPGCFTADEALEILQRTIGDGLALIEQCVSGDYADEFRKEFSSYWGHSTSSRGRHLTSICDPRGMARPISVWIGKNQIVAADTVDALRGWLKNYGASVKEDGKDIGLGAFIPLAQVPLPREYPRDVASLRTLVGVSNPAAMSVLDQVTLSEQKEIPIVLGVSTPSGVTLAGVLLAEKKSSGAAGRIVRNAKSRGFRPDKVPPNVLLARLGGGYGVTRLVAERADPAWIHGREADPRFTTLRQAAVVIVGCGSLGSAVAEMLAKAGIGRFILIDDEFLRWSNVGRHELGAGGVYRNKAQALKDRLLRDYPHIQDIAVFDRQLEQVLRGNEDSLKVNLVIDATADWAAGRMLDDWHRSNEKHPPVIYGWMEEHACAGHAVLIANGDSLQTGFDSTGNPLYPVTSWASGDQLVKEPGCGAVFQPYGPVELTHTSALVAELASDALLGNARGTVHRIWVARQSFLVDCGGAWSPWWLQMFPDDQNGGVTKECAWPGKANDDSSEKEAA